LSTEWKSDSDSPAIEGQPERSARVSPVAQDYALCNSCGMVITLVEGGAALVNYLPSRFSRAQSSQSLSCHSQLASHSEGCHALEDRLRCYGVPGWQRVYSLRWL